MYLVNGLIQDVLLFMVIIFVIMLAMKKIRLKEISATKLTIYIQPLIISISIFTLFSLSTTFLLGGYLTLYGTLIDIIRHYRGIGIGIYVIIRYGVSIGVFLSLAIKKEKQGQERQERVNRQQEYTQQEFTKYQELLMQGVITEAEYDEIRQKLLKNKGNF